MASTLQLEFSQAMSDFKTMFPDMDHDVIEAVLRANQGAVDATIDQLLAMSTDNQNEKIRNELDATVSPQQSLINLNVSDSDMTRNIKLTNPVTPLLVDTTEGGAKSQANSNNAAAAANAMLLNLSGATGVSPHHTGASPKQRLPASVTKTGFSTTGAAATASNRTLGSRRWNPPMLRPLPPGFLRIAPTPSQEYELPDEQFAMMLQNEEFMNQLRWNQEFMNALEKEQTGKTKTEDDAAFKERLKTMGKISRKKFLQIARVFTWQRNKKVSSAKQFDSLPLKEEPSDDEDHNLRVRK